MTASGNAPPAHPPKIILDRFHRRGEQWGEISPHVEPVAFHPEEAGRMLVEVHQVVRDLAGAMLANDQVGHRFTLEGGRIRNMEVCPLP